MMKKILVALSLVLTVSGCTWISEYFRGEDNTEKPTPLTEFKPGIEVEQVWNVDTGEGAGEQRLNLQPLVADGKVFVSDRSGKVLAYDLASGKQVWEVNTRAVITAGVGGSEDLLLAGTRGGEIIALSRKDGKQVWRTRVSTEVLAVPVMAKGIVVVRTIDGTVAGLNATTGKLTWEYSQREPSLTLRGTSSPVIAGDVVISGFDNGKLVALSLFEGKVVWQRTITEPRGRSELERLVDLDGTPVVTDGVVYVVSYRGDISAVSILDGQLLWNRKMSSYKGLTLDGKQLYITDAESQLWALYRTNGASLWKQEKLKWRSITRPAVMGDYLVVGDVEGYLHWINRDDGKFLSRTQGDKKGYYAAPVVSGSTLVTLGVSGELTAYRVAKKKP